jgi:hypothetical protein
MSDVTSTDLYDVTMPTDTAVPRCPAYDGDGDGDDSDPRAPQAMRRSRQRTLRGARRRAVLDWPDRHEGKPSWTQNLLT